MILILGGSGCGKSSYAENRIMELAQSLPEGEKMPVYYLATMQVYGEEGRKKVERHKQLRFGKGMLTLEQTRRVDEALSRMQEGSKAVLLEDLGNLVANEMFSDEGHEDTDWEKIADRITAQLTNLNSSVTHLVIVSNNVFEDGVEYEDSTARYISALGRVNTALAKVADSVVEVVVGIPLEKKKNILK